MIKALSRATEIRLRYLLYMIKYLLGRVAPPLLSYHEWEWTAFEWWSEPNLDWLCICGHYQEDGLHCDSCGREPPWGCDCSACQDRETEDAPDEWLYSWADYPGQLLAGSIELDNLRDEE